MGTRWLTAKEAAEHSGYHLETVRDALRSGELMGKQRTTAGTWRTTEAWVDAWLGQGEDLAVAA